MSDHLITIYARDKRTILTRFRVPEAKVEEAMEDPLFKLFYRSREPIQTLAQARKAVEEAGHESRTPRREAAVVEALDDHPRSADEIREVAETTTGLGFGHGNALLRILDEHAERVGTGRDERYVRKEPTDG